MSGNSGSAVELQPQYGNFAAQNASQTSFQQHTSISHHAARRTPSKQWVIFIMLRPVLLDDALIEGVQCSKVGKALSIRPVHKKRVNKKLLEFQRKENCSKLRAGIPIFVLVEC